MLRRTLISLMLGCALLLAAGGCRHAKVNNPIAGVDSKQPDKILFDRAMNAMKGARYGEARTLLETLINTYPDSEYVARAKMSIGDAWVAEGGAAGKLQAEAEYRDFQTFFPDLPEAAEAQLKIANIHYRDMEKYDRDYSHATRAEDEYKEMIKRYPNSPLLPEAKQKLRDVQEVLAQRQFGIARFYFLRNNFAASQARFISLADSYPLYSGVDEALFMLGDIYEREAKALLLQNIPAATKERVVAEYQKRAIEYYSRILTRYPAMRRADDARQRLVALKAPIPTPTAEAMAESRAEEDSRDSTGRVNSLLNTFRRHPDVAKSAKAGEPSLEPPKEASAPAIVHQLQADIAGAQLAGASPAGTGTNANAGSSNGSDSVNLTVTKGTGTPGQSQATPGTINRDGTAPPPAPTRVNEIDPSAAPPPTDQATADKQKDSTSQKKKKKGLRKLIPF
ncbi:MAG TPA: outer membrane protein assembly factor BamD [Candidatus Angelobacter sp.]|nr:outer membrane protein assembly factor BamD [Candidatus Angelobacter sp.]